MKDLKVVMDDLKVVLEDKDNQLLVFNPKRQWFSCSQCGASGYGGNPGCIKHKETCPYYY
jgi:hypothetical protein